MRLTRTIALLGALASASLLTTALPASALPIKGDSPTLKSTTTIAPVASTDGGVVLARGNDDPWLISKPKKAPIVLSGVDETGDITRKPILPGPKACPLVTAALVASRDVWDLDINGKPVGI